MATFNRSSGARNLFFGIALALLFFLSKSEFVFSGSPSTGLWIVNVHEHIQSRQLVPKLLGVMNQQGILKSVLLGSPSATLHGAQEKENFEKYEENNQEILQIAKDHPDRFIPFVTLDPRDPRKLEKFKQDLTRGAQGLKLYSGHVIFHDLPLNDPSMDSVYAFCESKKIPIMLHVNAGYYLAEFEGVLNQYPRLKVICPHFCLSTIATDRFERLMDQHPNLYTDLSFGSLDYLMPALFRFSKEPEKYRKLILKYQDRIFFGVDAVVTDEPHQTLEWLNDLVQVYKDVLEKQFYTTPFYPFQSLRGLSLSKDILDKIYYRNYSQFIT